jgi:hypothetical protein
MHVHINAAPPAVQRARWRCLPLRCDLAHRSSLGCTSWPHVIHVALRVSAPATNSSHSTQCPSDSPGLPRSGSLASLCSHVYTVTVCPTTLQMQASHDIEQLLRSTRSKQTMLTLAEPSAVDSFFARQLIHGLQGCRVQAPALYLAGKLQNADDVNLTICVLQVV